MARSRTPAVLSVTRIGTAIVVLLCLVTLLTAASGTVAADVDVSLQPSDGEVEEGEETTFEVVVEGADEGVGAHDIEITLADGDVAEITDIAFVNDPQLQAQRGVSDDGTTATAVAAMGGNVYEAADEITILELTVEGNALGESTDLAIAERSRVGDTAGEEYTIDTFSGATVSIVEEGTGDGDTDSDSDSDDGDGDDSDGSGPGFGIGGALAALAGLGYLARRTDD